MTTAPAGIDTRDMLLIHRVIRREIGRLPGSRPTPARCLTSCTPITPAFSLIGRRQYARETAAVHG
jgi:hypothetical protein